MTRRYFIGGVAKIVAASIVATSAFFLHGYTVEYAIDHPSSILAPFADSSLPTHKFLRTTRTCIALSSVVADYKYSLSKFKQLDRDQRLASPDFLEIFSRVNERASKRILWLCQTNKGVYIKAGQFLASIHGIPKEFGETLSVVQDKINPRPFMQIKKTIEEELGPINLIFDELDHMPLGSASIAQVHKGKLRDSKKQVAVKVQHAGIESISYADISTLKFLSPIVTWFFPDFEFAWILPEFDKAMKMELDFIQEGKNAERFADNFRDFPQVKVPEIQWPFTTKHILMMEYETGVKINEKEKIEKLGIDKNLVCHLLTEVYAKQMLVDGFLHSDPHPGNLLVRPLQPGSNKPLLVVLDHGLYKEFDEDFLINYAQFWRALVFRDTEKVLAYGQKLGMGELTDLMAFVLARKSDEEKFKSRKFTKEDKDKFNERFKNFKLNEFLEGLPRELVFIFKTEFLTRSINRALATEHIPTMQIMARHSLLSIYFQKDKAVGILRRWWNYLVYMFERVYLEVFFWSAPIVMKIYKTSV
eukprot:TRINITY_DN4884_c0_g1_i2.p1 TRINITY_DN4884_c0_g1~~TRINITY_DN4884_c0_g1_i2.p1  ORF type:complete len:531 (+),score=72.52 TRINITY_DN4884_c0_g1_i2:14-1606(+)